jgi:hypothetical protein
VARTTLRPATVNRRGSPEAIAKRRAGRAFNDLWQPSVGGVRLDGRTETRRQRLLRELEQGKARGSGRELKPLDVLGHVSELLELGVPLGTIRKVCRLRAAPRADASLVDVVTRLHDAYGFRPEAYRFVGLEESVLRSAGVLGEARRPRAAPHGVRGAPLGRSAAAARSEGAAPEDRRPVRPKVGGRP